MLYDLLFIAIVLLCVIVGYVRGAAKSIVTLLGFLASFLIAVFLGDFLTDFVYDSYLSSAIINSVKDSLNAESISADVTLPPFVSLVMSLTGFDYEEALLSAVQNAPMAIATAFESAVKPVVVSVLSFVFTTIIFFVLYFVFRLVLRKILLFFFNLPVISFFNKLIGGVCGLFSSLFIVSFIAFLLKTVMPYLTDIPYFLSESTIYNSYIFYHFYSGNIFSTIISIF